MLRLQPQGLRGFLGGGPDKQRLTFFSKILKQVERRNTTLRQELLVVFLSIKHFRLCAECDRVIIIYADHMPLISAIQTTSSMCNEREVRHLDVPSQFDFDFRHVSESDNDAPVALTDK